MDKIWILCTENANIIVPLVLLFGIFWLLFKKQYQIFIDAIVYVEKKLNTESGQDKLDSAVLLVLTKTPTLLKPFATKRVVVTIIEYLLNKGLHYLKSDYKVDVKGNEEILGGKDGEKDK